MLSQLTSKEMERRVTLANIRLESSKLLLLHKNKTKFKKKKKKSRNCQNQLCQNIRAVENLFGIFTCLCPIPSSI